MGVVHGEGYWQYGLDVLAHDNYISVNRTLIKAVGLSGAVLIGELLSEARYYASEGLLDDGWFYSTVENIATRCGLSKHQQVEALKDLMELSLVDVEYRGIPRKRYVRVDAVKTIDLINQQRVSDKSSDFSPTGGQKVSQQEGEKSGVNKPNKNPNKKPEEKTESAMDKPCRLNKHPDEIKAVIDYFNERVGTRYTYRNKKINGLISARLEEGFTVDDFKRVIDVKVSDWTGTEWVRFLKPTTLFAPSHFEDYLNERQPTPKADFSAYAVENWAHPVEHRGGGNGAPVDS